MNDVDGALNESLPIDDVEKRWRRRLAFALALAGASLLAGTAAAVAWLVSA